MLAIQGLTTDSCPPIILTAITPQDSDIVLPSTTLSGKKRLATFGEAIAPVGASGLALLGENAQGDAMRRVVQFFRANRVSKNQRTVRMSFPGGAVSVAVTSFTPSQVDAEYNIMPFQIGGYVMEGV